MQCNRCKKDVSGYRDSKDPLADYKAQPKKKLILCDICFKKRAEYLKQAKNKLIERGHINVTNDEHPYYPDYPRPFEELHVK
jgi:hypothetical protein